MTAFNVNMDKVIGLTAKLERINRFAFPVAVRQTLNDAAFTTKKMVPKVAAQKFTTRQKNFFRAFSTVVKANGYTVNGMNAIAGINPQKGSDVAEGLEQQEIGGTISSRKLIPHNKGRVSGNHSKKVRKTNYLNRLNISPPKNRKKNSKYLLIKKGSKGTVFHIKNLKTKSKLTPVYVYRRTKNSRVQKSPFMAPSAMYARSKMSEFYIKNAEFQFKRALK
nr:hypothetical protein [uncultured Allomuricauda sp.]